MNIFESLLEKHHELDFAVRDKTGKVFFSDWNCENPFTNAYLEGIDPSLNQETGINTYMFFEDDKNLIKQISNFHNFHEGLEIDNKNLIGGDGSTPFILTFCIWLYEQGVKEIFYIPPLYYNFYYFLKLFKIKVRPIANNHPFETPFEFNFPSKKCTLIFCDPIWYSGTAINVELIEKVKKWQNKTGSIIFIDGSFQYMKWNGQINEPTSKLDPNLTFRLICPTKSLAIHGFRFSYLLLPEEHRNSLRYIYASSHGATTIHNLRFAQKAMEILTDNNSNQKLTQHISTIYQKLISEKHIESKISPDCGYFVFAKVNKEISKEKRLEMGGEFFEQENYPNYVRINLLAKDTLSFFFNN